MAFKADIFSKMSAMPASNIKRANTLYWLLWRMIGRLGIDFGYLQYFYVTVSCMGKFILLYSFLFEAFIDIPFNISKRQSSF